MDARGWRPVAPPLHATDWTKPNIIAGDFNMVTNPALDRQPPTTTKECPQNFKELCETFKIHIVYFKIILRFLQEDRDTDSHA